MTWAVVVRRGQETNITLSSILFDKWGKKTNQSVVVADDWQDGYLHVKKQGYRQALFVDSGTIFRDWPIWKDLVDHYPHRGLIGHLIWHQKTHPYLHPQCWFMDLDRFDFAASDLVTYPCPIRSDQNLHDDYTPLWVKPGKELISHPVTGFGQTLIAKQLNTGLPVVNWNKVARSEKIYRYDRSQSVRDCFPDYLTLAESQLWILNNEPISDLKARKLICPGSGLFWMLNMISNGVEEIKILDISETQVKFCRDLWNKWDGRDYGEFVCQFIKDNGVDHYQLDKTDFDPIEQIKFKSPARLKTYVNNRFNEVMGSDEEFSKLWNLARESRKFNADVGNLIDWVIQNNGLGEYDTIWASNILDYKWSMIHSDPTKCQRFMELVG